MKLTKDKPTVRNNGYEIASVTADSDGWYRLKNDAGLYKGRLDPFTGSPQDQYGELRLEYGDDQNKKTVSYIGNVEDGLIQGEGKMMWPCGTVYRGEFNYGCRHGKGILILPDGTEIEKEFCKGAEVVFIK